MLTITQAFAQCKIFLEGTLATREFSFAQLVQHVFWREGAVECRQFAGRRQYYFDI